MLREIQQVQFECGDETAAWIGRIDVLKEIISRIPPGKPILCQGCAELKQVRGPVRWFALEMEKTLKRNDRKKGGWARLDFEDLMCKLWGEFKELNDADNNSDRVSEAIDMANYTMMIAYNLSHEGKNQ